MATDSAQQNVSDDRLLHLSANIVTAYVSHNVLPASAIPEVITIVHKTLFALSRSPEEADQPQRKPAVAIRRSVTNDYIVCLEDGKRLKMLKRYLRSNYGLSPAEYRTKWGLPVDYPMVAPNYAKQRSEFAKKIGLGRASKKASKSRASKRK